MTPLALTEDEARLLQMVLQSKLSALTVEIAHTDRREFRELLQQQATLLEGALGKVLATLTGSGQTTGYRKA